MKAKFLAIIIGVIAVHPSLHAEYAIQLGAYKQLPLLEKQINRIEDEALLLPLLVKKEHGLYSAYTKSVQHKSKLKKVLVKYQQVFKD
ncbi:MAG TPA: hypothetical protein ENK72_01030, partial [Epsilonproteobacteria bacterium]|nr:hypothetical protein [Campylobacterota bacterium]